MQNYEKRPWLLFVFHIVILLLLFTTFQVKAQIFQDDFSTLDSDKYVIYHDAMYGSQGEDIRLTQ